MNIKLRELPLNERILLVEAIWDSIAAEQNSLPMTPAQQAELDRRINAYEADRNTGKIAEEVIAAIRKKL